MDVRVHRAAADLVLVGESPAGPAGVGIVAVPAAEIHLDPTAPDGPPYAVVHDVHEAEYALSRVYGRGVVEAAEQLDDGETALVAVEPTPDSAAFHTLGLLTWLRQWSPDLLPVGLLDVESAVTALALDNVVADHLRRAAEDRLARRADLAVALSRRLRDGAAGPPPGLSDLVATSVRELRGLLAPDDPYHDDVEHEAELAGALERLGVGGVLDWAVLDWTALADRPEVGVRTLVGAVTLGPPSRSADDGTERVDSVDWHQVPRGLLDSAEETVRWSLRDGPEVTVAVRAAVGAGPSERLAFRLYAAGRPLPVACGPLRRSADSAEFTGRAPVLGPTAGALVLDVHDTLETRPPRLGPNRVMAGAMRWAARGVTGLRLGDGSPAADEVARGALWAAAGLFADLVVDDPRPLGQALARRRSARCMALVGAIMRRAGQYRAAEQILRRFPAGDPVTGADVRAPELSGTGWTPTVTERTLGVDPRWRAP